MSEISRIAMLLQSGFEGDAYYGPSVRRALEGITADLAARRPHGAAHNIWELVLHLTAELKYAREVIEGTAGPWVAGSTTWSSTVDQSEHAWHIAMEELTEANRGLLGAVKTLDDSVLEEQATVVHVTHYVMLHGTIQHSAYHAGQIALLKRQVTAA